MNKKKGRPKKDPKDKITAYYIYLLPNEAEKIIKEHGTLTRYFRTFIK